jgi:hypothetical protein
MEDVSELLILRAPKLNKRLERLLDQMQTDPGLRQWYLTDPARVIMARIFPEALGAVTRAEINRGNLNELGGFNHESRRAPCP